MENTSRTIKPGWDELDETETAFLIIEAVIFVPTVIGNSLIILSVYKFNWLQTPLNALIVNLAFGDLLLGLLLIPLDVTGTFFGLNSYEYVCLIQLATMLTLLFSSLLSMLAISVERCFSVSYPHKHRTMKRKPFVTIFIVLSWVFAVTFSSIPVMGWNTFSTRRKCKHLTVWPQNFRYIANTLIIIMVIAQIVFFSLTVRVALKRLNKYNNTREGVALKRRMAKTYVLIIISAMFIVCWAPYCTVSSTKLFLPYDPDTLTNIISWTLLLALCNGALNWLIYGLKNPHFRKAFKMLLCRQQPMHIEDRTSST